MNITSACTRACDWACVCAIALSECVRAFVCVCSLQVPVRPFQHDQHQLVPQPRALQGRQDIHVVFLCGRGWMAAYAAAAAAAVVVVVTDIWGDRSAFILGDTVVPRPKTTRRHGLLSLASPLPRSSQPASYY